MKLTRLELSGFKSFADTVHLDLDDGITAIVGPNGCGKSNISDAVRWVLGEQRARMLRGARMDEVIFQGSAKRRPINIAEVSLIFDNGDGALAVPQHEVAVTRRLSRNGQSDYLLNQASVRLRDVQDLLRGTGLGSDAGVVMEARMIDRLLSDRADERRSLFEEAAGIGLYRDRKATTERRLEKTSEDLQRLADLINEVQSQVRSLARQRGKAERHAKFTEERFAVVITLARRDLATFDARHDALKQRRVMLARRIPEARELVSNREREREARVQARATAIARQTEVERRLGNTRLEAERLDGDLKLAGERLEHAQSRRARATESRTLATSRAEQAARELEAAGTERQAAEEARASVQMELDLRTANEDEVRERFATQRNRVRELEGALHQLAEAHRSLVGERAALERELADLNQQQFDAQARLDETTHAFAEATAELDRAQATLDQTERDEQAASEALERARHELATTRDIESALRLERRRAEERLAQLAARRDALQELERRREGLAPAARAVLEGRERFGDGAVLGPLSDFLTTTADEAQVTERLLGDSLHAVLVRDRAVVDAVREWHDAVQPGPLVLLPVDPGPVVRAVAAPQQSTVTAREPAHAWVAALLSENRRLDAAGASIQRASGAIYLPGAESAGPLSRRAELETLERELADTEARQRDLTSRLEAAGLAHQRAERELDAATERMAAVRTAQLEAQGRHDDAARRKLRTSQERKESDAALARVVERAEARRARLATVETELGAGEQRHAQLEQQLQDQRSALEELEAAQEAARERRVHWQVEEAQVSARETAAREREERARRTLDEAHRDIESLARELHETDALVTELTSQRAQWTDTLAERRVAVGELDHAAAEAAAELERAETALAQAEHAVDEARTARDELTEEHHRLELEYTESEGRRRALIERIETEWHKPLDTLLAEAPNLDAETDVLRAEAERLTQALETIGPVNQLAVHEHAEEVKRLEFLSGQRDDLVDARNSLLQALREIDQTARTMFLDTFQAIRDHFHEVFRTLFEGGECDVRLADDADPLGSEIEIHAAPRGKRTQRIHLLSSGERALVAISLLFSIYLTKPAPFCLLDEVDAPLDDANVMRFVRLLEEFKSGTQFIVITHNPRTMQVADAVYGVTMQEPGVSTIVGVRLSEVEPAMT